MMEPPRPIAVYALTSTGANKARAIAWGLPQATVFLPRDLAEPEKGEVQFSRLAEILAHNFRQFNGHVVVAAAGIVVRSLVRLIKDKATDPAVVVVDQEGRFAISLLSGHLGGANSLAEAVAGILGGQAVITTATDSAGKPSLEVIAAGRGLKTENLKALSRISRIILENGPIPVFDPDGWLWPGLTSWPENFKRLDAPPDLAQKTPLVWVGHETRPFPDSWLPIRPPSLILGMGCNRHTDVEELAGLVDDVFKSHSLAVASIGGLVSIAAKRDEAGLLALAERFNLEPIFFQPEELAVIQTPTPSGVVEKHMGVKSVCEAAALLAARTDRLLVTKQKSLNATLAVALTNSTLSAWDRETNEG